MVADILRMIKFSHTIFALPFAGIAVLLALPGSPYWDFNASFYVLLAKILICMVALRTGAMTFNRVVDRDFDAANPRTAKREIPSGVISVRAGWTVIAVVTMIFIAAAFSINFLCGVLSPAAVFITYGYSYTKRFTMFSHFVLGLGIGLAPTGAWIAMRGTIELAPVLWTVAMMFYIGGFDILYSCQDVDFDKGTGLHSLPSRIGVRSALYVARVSHILALSFFIAAGRLSGTGTIFLLTTAVVGVLFMLEHILVRPDNLDHVPVAFFNINASISTILFVGLGLDRFL